VLVVQINATVMGHTQYSQHLSLLAEEFPPAICAASLLNPKQLRALRDAFARGFAMAGYR
jgi:hypothetical protein